MRRYASASMEPSTASAWRDLYVGMVGAGASLTGLTFVAIALWCFVSVMFIGLAVLTRMLLNAS